MTSGRFNLLASSSLRRPALIALLVFAGSYLGALAGTLASFPGLGTAVLFPPYAVLAAALMLSPKREWWVYVLASAAGNFWPHLSFERMTWFVLIAEAANVSRALIAAWGVRRFSESTGLFDSARGIVVFMAFAVVIGPVIGAFIGATGVVLRSPSADFWPVWQAWLLSNMLTGLTLLPLILIICTRARAWRRGIGGVPVSGWIEAGVLSLGVIVLALHIFYGDHERGVIPASLYAPLPLLIWAAVRFGPGAVIATLSVVAGITIAGAIGGRGPFVARAPAENLLQLQYFLIALCTPLLLLAALVRQQGQTAASLRRTQTEYQTVVEDQTELICRFRPDGSYTFVNGAYCRYFQRTREQLIGRAFWEYIPVEAHAGLRAHLASMTPERPVRSVEHEVVAPGGEIRWQHWTDRAFFDAHGRIVDYQAVGRDITDRKRAEESLRIANAELRQLKERLQAQNTYLQEELTASESVADIICRSPVMRQTLAQVQRVAGTDATVLLLGETGAGKEVVAREIHRRSLRQDRPFVRLNCAALPAHLIESELFGHERGAFTGATSQRLGRFEVADGATLFLDEIGELPLELQAKLLRVLQEGEFERLGSSKTIKVDARLIAATSRNLPECVQRGTFRPDLFYRLNVFPLTVPPLRLRQEDVVPLAAVFLAKVGERLGKHFAPLSNGVAEALLRHSWPGNVRELQNLIERAAISSLGLVLELPEGWHGLDPRSMAPVMIERPQGVVSPNGAPQQSRTGAGSGEIPSIRELERAHIMLALERSNWRIEGLGGAAAMLGMKPSTLRFRMKKLDISRGEPKLG